MLYMLLCRELKLIIFNFAHLMTNFFILATNKIKYKMFVELKLILSELNFLNIVFILVLHFFMNSCA